MKVILGFLLAFFVTFSIGTAFGHGAGIEASPLVFTNDREVKVTVELLPSDFYKSDQKMIQEELEIQRKKIEDLYKKQNIKKKNE